jgi:hypothetical protein
MLVLFLSVIASLHSLTYKPGDVFSFNYHSSVKSTADQSQNDDQVSIQDADCTATFKVLLVTSDGYYIQLDVDNISSTITTGSTSEHQPPNADTDEVCRLFFFLRGFTFFYCI